MNERNRVPFRAVLAVAMVAAANPPLHGEAQAAAPSCVGTATAIAANAPEGSVLFSLFGRGADALLVTRREPRPGHVSLILTDRRESLEVHAVRDPGSGWIEVTYDRSDGHRLRFHRDPGGTIFGDDPGALDSLLAGPSRLMALIRDYAADAGEQTRRRREILTQPAAGGSGTSVVESEFDRCLDECALGCDLDCAWECRLGLLDPTGLLCATCQTACSTGCAIGCRPAPRRTDP